MERAEGYWAPRDCLLAPLPEHEIAARLLSDAADAILATKLELARDLVRQADMPVLFDFSDMVMRGKSPEVQRRRKIPLRVGAVAKVASRMPSSEATNALFARDGWRCRFCACRVVPPRARDAMRAALPGAVPWSESEGFHGSFYALSASVDHVVPHSEGGTNHEENLVTACWACQFGRGAWSLEEVGLHDPRNRAPVKDDWDGLTRLLTRSPPFAVNSMAMQTVDAETACQVRDVPPPMPKRSRISNLDWFAALDAVHSSASSRLIEFVNGCSDLGVSWGLRDVLLIQVTAGTETLNVIGIQQNGLCEIPWAIGDAKDAFKVFADTLAGAIPGAICYETPRMWRVAWPDKIRVNVLDLLDASPMLRLAFEMLRSELQAENRQESVATA